MIKKILQWKLKILAKLYLWKYRPMIIGVTGNAGKTSTKEMVGVVVSRIKRVRIAAGNLNNELGLPLTIIGSWDDEYYTHGPSVWFWARVLMHGWLDLFKKQRYPEVLILEYGADRPGDIQKLVKNFKPHIAVITTVGDMPVHVEYFKSADSLANEKANLIKVMSANDYAILNHDDERVLNMRTKTKAKVKTYGFSPEANIHASNIEHLISEEGRPVGVTFKLDEGTHFIPVLIKGSLGKSQAWSSAAAAAVGTVLGMNLVDISEVLSSYRGPNGRLKVLRGIKNSNIIDDTYNASPASTRLALETIKDVPALRKILVLGDMLELGEHSEESHRKIGQFASEITDVLVCVGSRAKAIAEAAAERLSPDRIFTFDNSTEAKTKVRELIHEHDLILVKGSQGMRMEKIVAEILAESSQAKDILVRQSKAWLSK